MMSNPQTYNGATGLTQPQVQNPFGTLEKLAPEIREQIYGYVLDLNSTNHEYLPPRATRDPRMRYTLSMRRAPLLRYILPAQRTALLRVCRAINNEAHIVLFRSNVFYIRTVPAFGKVWDGSDCYQWSLGFSRSRWHQAGMYFHNMSVLPAVGAFGSIIFRPDMLREIQHFNVAIEEVDGYSRGSNSNFDFSESPDIRTDLLANVAKIRKFLGDFTSIKTLEVRTLLLIPGPAILEPATPYIAEPYIKELLLLKNIKNNSAVAISTIERNSRDQSVIRAFELSREYAGYISYMLRRPERVEFSGQKYVKTFDAIAAAAAAKLKRIEDDAAAIRLWLGQDWMPGMAIP